MIVLVVVILFSLVTGASILLIPWCAVNKRSAAKTSDRDRLNQAIYQARLKELSAEMPCANSLAPDLSERQQMIQELQQNLLEDIPQQPPASQLTSNHWFYLPGILVLVLLSIGVFVKTSQIRSVLEWQKVTQQTPQLLQRLMHPGDSPPDTEEMARLALGLRTRLQAHPDNLQSWIMLGHIHMTLNNHNAALQAFKKAWQLNPKDTEARLGYAEILTRSASTPDNRKAGEILREMLKTDHTNPRVLTLLAFNAFGLQNYQEAIGAWQMLLRVLPDDDKRRQVIERSIAQAKTEQNMTQ